MITSIVENYQKSNRLPIKNMFFGKKKELKNEAEDTSCLLYTSDAADE